MQIASKIGFSLIEVLIVITIIGTVITFALPSYSQHIVHVRRLSAETALMQLAAQLETYFAQHNSYEGANFTNLNTSEWIAENNYRLAILSATASKFEIAAIPQNQQAKRDTQCGELKLNSVGARNAALNTTNTCW